MLLRDQRRHCVGRELIAPILRAGQSKSGWRLVGWDDEQGLQLTLEFESTLLLIELEPRNDAKHCFDRTALFNVCVRHSFDYGKPLSARARTLVAALVEMVRARERHLPSFERPVTNERSLVRELTVDRVLVCEGAGHYYINPYAGCVSGCEFCYVADRADWSRHLEGLPSLPWGRYVDVKLNAAEVLQREVREHPPGIVRLSPILTDPYQPIERTYRITRQCLEVLLDAGYCPAILTRAHRVVDDLELLRRFETAAVGFTIPTDDDAIRRAFEPGTDPIEERIEALARCHEAGLRTFAIVQPALPMNVQKLVDRIAPYVYAVRIDRMYEVERVRGLYEGCEREDAMTDEFFERTIRELREAFAARGVPVDDLDDIGTMLGMKRNMEHADA
jgi:DNA repair photolyase